MIVKSNLKNLMAKHKMTIEDVHKETGLSRTTISKLYNEASTTIAFETIKKLCTLFGVSVGELLVIKDSNG